jgi:hypothetical protein
MLSYVLECKACFARIADKGKASFALQVYPPIINQSSPPNDTVH